MATKCPKCHYENPSDIYYCRKCATQIRPLEGDILSKTMTVGMPYKALGPGSLVAGKYRIQSELGRRG